MFHAKTTGRRLGFLGPARNPNWDSGRTRFHSESQKADCDSLINDSSDNVPSKFGQLAHPNSHVLNQTETDLLLCTLADIQ